MYFSNICGNLILANSRHSGENALGMYILLRIDKICSLVHSSVNALALIATATKGLREEVQSIVGMRSPAVIAVSPSKPNIIFIGKTSNTLAQAFLPMLEQLCRAGPTIVIFLFSL